MNKSDILIKLRKYGRKTITKTQLQSLLGISDDEFLFITVSELQNDNILVPIHNSKTNGNRVYPVYLKYRINIPDENFEAELGEIQKLHPRLQSGSYLIDHPAVYRQHREDFNLLDSYFFKSRSSPVPVSRKERSFEIFGEEKRLDDSTFCRLLENLNLNSETLSFYDTPEYCFNDFIPVKKSNMTLLICENKDIWFNIRRRMFENRASEILGIHIDGTVFGGGNAVSENHALTNYSKFMGDTDITYLYWGDIDRAGLNIYLSLLKNNPELKIKLFTPGYEEMLRLAQNCTIPDSEDRREIMGDYEEIYASVSEKYRDAFKMNILKNKRIPQEIITYENLLTIMR